MYSPCVNLFKICTILKVFFLVNTESLAQSVGPFYEFFFVGGAAEQFFISIIFFYWVVQVLRLQELVFTDAGSAGDRGYLAQPVSYTMHVCEIHILLILNSSIL